MDLDIVCNKTIPFNILRVMTCEYEELSSLIQPSIFQMVCETVQATLAALFSRLLMTCSNKRETKGEMNQAGSGIRRGLVACSRNVTSMKEDSERYYTTNLALWAMATHASFCQGLYLSSLDGF